MMSVSHITHAGDEHSQPISQKKEILNQSREREKNHSTEHAKPLPGSAFFSIAHKQRF
jgi:hypothetical protein